MFWAGSCNLQWLFASSCWRNSWGGACCSPIVFSSPFFVSTWPQLTLLLAKLSLCVLLTYVAQGWWYRWLLTREVMELAVRCATFMSLLLSLPQWKQEPCCSFLVYTGIFGGHCSSEPVRHVRSCIPISSSGRNTGTLCSVASILFSSDIVLFLSKGRAAMMLSKRRSSHIWTEKCFGSKILLLSKMIPAGKSLWPAGRLSCFTT